MVRRFLLVLVLLLACLTTFNQSAFASSPGWLMRCPLSHTLSDDPIVAPGQPGAAHSHDFFGNTSTNASSTFDTMLTASTTCGTAADTAAYWTPTLLRNGVVVKPAGSYNGRSTRQQIYYRANNLASGTKVEPFPANLRMVAGNGHATSVATNPQLGREIYWGCSDNSTSGKLTDPANCNTGIITLHIGFPNCWNGSLSGTNDTPNMAYPSSGKCPSTHPRTLPRLLERFEYPVGTSSAGITLASGPTYTAHADFWNAWEQPALVSLVNRCLNSGIDCGTNPVP